MIMVNNLLEVNSLREVTAPMGVHLHLQAIGAHQEMGETITAVQEDEATVAGDREDHLLMAAVEVEVTAEVTVEVTAVVTAEVTVDMEVVAAVVLTVVVAMTEEVLEAAVVEVALEVEVVVAAAVAVVGVAAMATPIASCLIIKSMHLACQPTCPKMTLQTSLAPLV
jgi:Ca2+/H+ antiporter